MEDGAVSVFFKNRTLHLLYYRNRPFSFVDNNRPPGGQSFSHSPALHLRVILLDAGVDVSNQTSSCVTTLILHYFPIKAFHASRLA